VLTPVARSDSSLVDAQHFEVYATRRAASERHQSTSSMPRPEQLKLLVAHRTDRPSVLMSLASHCFPLNSCSQTRKTRYPSFRKRARKRLSRARLSRIFLLQNAARVLGILRAHCGQACQKQPSRKSAKFCWGKTRSGLAGRPPGCLTHPRIPCLISTAYARPSVDRLPLPRTFDIRADRWDAVNGSLIISEADLLDSSGGRRRRELKSRQIESWVVLPQEQRSLIEHPLPEEAARSTIVELD